MNNIIINAKIFEELCEISSIDLFKIAIIRKIPKGYWGIFSEEGKLLGKFKTKRKAVKRLKQIEYFKKHKKKKASIEGDTYSSVLRELNDKYPEKIIQQFKKVFKEEFDNALIEGKENPEEIALDSALQLIDELDRELSKTASAIEMGDPIYAGKYIAEIIKFLMRRISPERRQKSIHGLKKKIYSLNEYDISNKKMPASSSLGQAISLTKNLLMMHSPQYVRSVLNSVVEHL